MVCTPCVIVALLVGAGSSSVDRQPVPSIGTPKVKAPVPPPHPKKEPGEKPVTPETARPPASDLSKADPTPGVPIAFPHPLITEVLYAVPGGEKGDANRDGTRHAAGDEFVELVNPHNKPIQLYGYTLTDRNPPKKGQLKFTFPSFELPPHAVVVVFNGCEQGWGKSEKGEALVGTQQQAPRRTNPNFHDAFVFTANVISSRTSWSNTGDYVLVSDPAGNPVQCVHWGEFAEPVPAATLLEKAPLTTKGSVQRTSLDGPYADHGNLKVPKAGGAESTPSDPATTAPRANDPKGESAEKKPSQTGVLFSPGWFPLPKVSVPEKEGKASPPKSTAPETPGSESPAKPKPSAEAPGVPAKPTKEKR